MRKRFGLALVAGCALGAAQAHAQDSFSLQVTVPPLGAAQAAQDAGAVGSWTVLTPAGGLMIAGPDVNGITIYRADANRFRLMTPGGSVLAPRGQEAKNGLTALTFDAIDGRTGGDGKSRLIVSAL